MKNNFYLFQILNRKKWFFTIACIVLLSAVFYLYSKSFSNFPILDDVGNLHTLNSLNDSWDNATAIITQNKSGPSGRPISMSSFIIDWFISPNDYGQMKLTNALIHLITACCGFALLSNLFSTFVEKKHQYIYAAFVTAMWLIAPIHVSTVLYPVQRMAQLSTLFSLISLLSYSYLRLKFIKNERYLPHIITVIISTFFIATGYFAKENAFVSVFLLILIESFFFSEHRIKQKRHIVYKISLFFAFIAFISFMILGPLYFNNFTHRNFDQYQRVITEIDVLRDYFRKIAFPDISSFGVYNDDFPITKSLLDSKTTLITLLLMIIPPIILLRSVNVNLKVVGFGICFFLCGHLIESSFIAIEIYFEHRNYLPAWGIFISISFVFIYFFEKAKSNIYKKAVVIAIVVYLGSISLSLNSLISHWQSEQNLIVHSYRSHPNSLRATNAMFNLLIENNNPKDAKTVIEAFTRNNPDRANATLPRKLMLSHYTNTAPNQDLYNQLSKPIPKQNYISIGYYYGLDGVVNLIIASKDTSISIPKLIEVLKTHIKYNTDRPRYLWGLYTNIAKLEAFSGNKKIAIANLQKAWKYIPENPTPGFMIIDIMLKKSEQETMREIIEKLEKQTPRSLISEWEKINRIKSSYCNKKHIKK